VAIDGLASQVAASCVASGVGVEAIARGLGVAAVWLTGVDRGAVVAGGAADV
jgi:hypothetical protein